MNNSKRRNRLNIIMKKVNKATGLTISKRKRAVEYVYARAIYYKLARELTHYSLAHIGVLVNKDHACVLHGLKTFELLIYWNETSYIEPYKKMFLELKNDFYFNDMADGQNKDKYYALLNHHIELKQKYNNLRTFVNIEFEHFLITAKKSYGYVPIGIKDKYESIKNNLGSYEKEVATTN